jgi:NCAIR mutase (PurE)-related protein
VDKDGVLELLQRIAAGEVSAEDGLQRLVDLPFAGGAGVLVDTHRPLRTGEREAVYCEGKTPEQAAAAFATLARNGGPVLATRAGDAHATAIRAAVPAADYRREARMVVLAGEPPPCGNLTVVYAGSSDLAVAAEAAVTAEALGAGVASIGDVGVAGLHRLLAHLGSLRDADVVIAVAGMEGALPSVIAGLVPAPVIAVPTSVGYGAAFAGLAPLLAMLNACAPGVAVVNIDNGFGAATVAVRMMRARREAAS